MGLAGVRPRPRCCADNRLDLRVGRSISDTPRSVREGFSFSQRLAPSLTEGAMLRLRRTGERDRRQGLVAMTQSREADRASCFRLGSVRTVAQVNGRKELGGALEV